jgi:hypothetical protein
VRIATFAEGQRCHQRRTVPRSQVASYTPPTPGRRALRRGCLPARWQPPLARHEQAPSGVGSNTGRTGRPQAA